MNIKGSLIGLFVMGTLGSAGASGLTSSQRLLATAAYEVGTDIGGEYLQKYGAKLFSFVILRECGESDLYQRLGSIPASFDYFMNHKKANVFVGDDKLIAAQITNGFLLGYQLALKSEYGRSDPAHKKTLCDEASLLAKAYISGDL